MISWLFINRDSEILQAEYILIIPLPSPVLDVAELARSQVGEPQWQVMNTVAVQASDGFIHRSSIFLDI